MDLSKGSSTTQSKDFIDLMSHPQKEEEEDQSGHGGTGSGIDKKEDIFPSYDFHPIHPFLGVGGSPPSSNFDSAPSNLGGSSRPWSSAESKPKTASPIRVIPAPTLLPSSFLYQSLATIIFVTEKCI